MQTYICQICGDAYIGERKPSECPFCGAREHFIKIGKEALPIVNQETKINETDKKNLLETLDLETKANAIYLCMAGKAKSYEIKAMYKRLAKVELEHATVVCKILKMEMPKINSESCSEKEAENFQKTIALEDHATKLYAGFAKASNEQNIKILFTALTQVESDHIDLVNSYIK